jgi:hypothetical protein
LTAAQDLKSFRLAAQAKAKQGTQISPVSAAEG